MFAIQWIAIEPTDLPFSTILDTVAQCAIGGLMMMLVGACVEIPDTAAQCAIDRDSYDWTSRRSAPVPRTNLRRRLMEYARRAIARISRWSKRGGSID